MLLSINLLFGAPLFESLERLADHVIHLRGSQTSGARRLNSEFFYPENMTIKEFKFFLFIPQENIILSLQSQCNLAKYGTRRNQRKRLLANALDSLDVTRIIIKVEVDGELLYVFAEKNILGDTFLIDYRYKHLLGLPLDGEAPLEMPDVRIFHISPVLEIFVLQQEQPDKSISKRRIDRCINASISALNISTKQSAPAYTEHWKNSSTAVKDPRNRWIDFATKMQRDFLNKI